LTSVLILVDFAFARPFWQHTALTAVLFAFGSTIDEISREIASLCTAFSADEYVRQRRPSRMCKEFLLCVAEHVADLASEPHRRDADDLTEDLGEMALICEAGRRSCAGEGEFGIAQVLLCAAWGFTSADQSLSRMVGACGWSLPRGEAQLFT